MPDTPVKDRKDAASEVEAKQQLVDCIRMLERSDIIDYNGHASIRVGDDRLLINIGSCQRASLTVADICTIDMEGNVIEGNGKPPLEFHLHAGVYRARPDVKAVVHAHPKWSTFLTMVGQSYSLCTRRARSSTRCRCSTLRIRSTTRSWPTGWLPRWATGPRP